MLKFSYKNESYRLKTIEYKIFPLLSITYCYRLIFTLDGYSSTHLYNIRKYMRLKNILFIEIVCIIH